MRATILALALATISLSGATLAGCKRPEPARRPLIRAAMRVGAALGGDGGAAFTDSGVAGMAAPFVSTDAGVVSIISMQCNLQPTGATNLWLFTPAGTAYIWNVRNGASYNSNTGAVLDNPAPKDITSALSDVLSTTGKVTGGQVPLIVTDNQTMTNVSNAETGKAIATPLPDDVVSAVQALEDAAANYTVTLIAQGKL